MKHSSLTPVDWWTAVLHNNLHDVFTKSVTFQKKDQKYKPDQQIVCLSIEVLSVQRLTYYIVFLLAGYSFTRLTGTHIQQKKRSVREKITTFLEYFSEHFSEHILFLLEISLALYPQPNYFYIINHKFEQTLLKRHKALSEVLSSTPCVVVKLVYTKFSLDSHNH